MNSLIRRRKDINSIAAASIICSLLFFACKKSNLERPLNVGTVRFESTAYSIENNSPDALNIVLPLSLPIEEDATVVITVDPSSTIAASEYKTAPAIPESGLVLTLPKGATEASINVSSLNNFEGDKQLVLKITSATGGVSVAQVNATTAVLIKGEPIVLPEIAVSTRTLSLGNVAAGSISTPQSYDLWGTKLTTDITVTASANFEISLDGNTYGQTLDLDAATVNISPVTIWVRFLANTGVNQSITGFITHTSSTVQDVTVAANGVEYGNAQPGVLVHKEDFEYGASAGNLKTVSSVWPVFSGTTRPIQYLPSGLSYSGYAGSAIGGAVVSENGSGSREDNSTDFPEQSAGTIYVAQMINIATAAGGDFFIALRNASGSYFNRIYVKDNAGSPQIGIGKSSATVAYSPGTYNYGTTYLLVSKYDFTTGVSSAYILSGAIPLVEPATPDATTSTGSGPASVENVCLRQNTTALTATYDGLRIATSWKEAVGK